MKLKKKIFILFFVIIILLNISTTVRAEEIDINSEAGLLVEVSTGKILYEKNADKIMYPASTTKILTAILVLENCELSDMVTVSQNAISNIPSGYVTCNLHAGEEISVNDLLYALMLPSANDAAFALAEHVGGSIENFSDMMNEKAKEIGCTNTHFVNPNGIHDDNHYTTAHDLYLMANYAMKNETFRTIVSKTEYVLPATNMHSQADRIMYNSNELLNNNSKNYYYENAIGIKTGTTSKAGSCLVAESSKNNMELISVTLNGGTTNGLNDRFTDSKKLFDYGYENYNFDNITEKNATISTIEIENGTKDTKNLNLIAENDISVLHNINLDLSTITPEITLNENLLAPISEGEIVGTAKYNVDGIEYTTNLLAGSNVEKKLDISIIILICGILLLFISVRILRKNKKHRNKRKYKK